MVSACSTYNSLQRNTACAELLSVEKYLPLTRPSFPCCYESVVLVRKACKRLLNPTRAAGNQITTENFHYLPTYLGVHQSAYTFRNFKASLVFLTLFFNFNRSAFRIFAHTGNTPKILLVSKNWSLKIVSNTPNAHFII